MIRKYAAEYLGSLLITLAVIGSGIMATRLSSDSGLQLLINCLSTTAVIYLVIVLFADISGAHFNPLVTLAAQFRGERNWLSAFFYILAQLLGVVSGALFANLNFELPAIAFSTTERSGTGLILGEVIASFGLVLIALARWADLTVRARAALIALWIAGAYFFTSSTAFANPIVTIGRSLSDSYAGIAPTSLASFLIAQLVGGLLAAIVVSSMERQDAK